jgi:uncharacterized protein
MHGIRHVERVASEALNLDEGSACSKDVIVIAAYLHGVIASHELEIRAFLRTLPLSEDVVELILKAAWESGKESHPTTREGTLLHDAHLLEGGRVFGVAKCLVTGSSRGQTLEETLNYIENNLLGKFRCLTPNAQALYEQKEEFLRGFVEELRAGLSSTPDQDWECHD